MLRCYLVEEKLAKVRNNKPDDLDKEYFSSHRLLHFSPVTLPVDLVAKFPALVKERGRGKKGFKA